MAILLQCPCETLQKQLCSTIYSLHLKNQTLKCIAITFYRSNVYSTSNLRKGKSRNLGGVATFSFPVIGRTIRTPDSSNRFSTFSF